MPAAPSISVITVCRNAEATISDCLESVRQQTTIPREHIVVDGLSSDGTTDTLNHFANPLLAWTSESDQGIGDAMNKGAARATGDWLLFLHADDYLADERVLEDVTPQLSDDLDLVAGDILFIYPEDGRSERRTPRGFGARNRLKTQFYHQAVFIRSDFFRQMNGYDAAFSIAMDYDFFLRAQNARARWKRIPRLISAMRQIGVSSRTDWPSLYERFMQEKRCHFKTSPNWRWTTLYVGYWALYPLYRWALSRLRS
ncbi:glycosyltransferase family 2 protein [Cerasicoccus frondis]|uniref:glycosyltransferase family 2 protein n=1 Tax=Cerasicoccus frondis TaxID=490090 RepID=UPI00285283D8|nr:glycosyltransferase family 2 protein [Cerasicoccus frondis]